MKHVTVKLGRRSYRIDIGRSSRAALREILQVAPSPRRIAVIADQRVAQLHLPRLLEALPSDPAILTVRPGERSKSLATAARLYDALARARIDRGDVIVTFGGGVIGDLGGFVAGTWLRGIRFVQVPTTLEAAVDASVGGKTGLNHRLGKNLVGVFHQPSAVFIDLDFLGTLPQRDYVAGLGESVKHALIRDAAFLAWHEERADAILAREPAALAELIARNCRIKADVVARDEREDNLRAILNFGHTIGHAVEHLLGYELRHGECVALGMLAANEIAVRHRRLDRSVARRVKALIARLRLPITLPRRLPPERVVTTCRMDKKHRGGTLNFVLMTSPGHVELVTNVTDADIAAAVRTINP